MGGQTLELDSRKLRELADRLHHAPTVAHRTIAAADAVIELRRLADGFDMLREVANEERQAAAAVVGGFVAAIQATGDYACDCDSCRLARGEAADGAPPRLSS